MAPGGLVSTLTMPRRLTASSTGGLTTGAGWPSGFLGSGDGSGSGVSQVIFADAILPHPGRTWFETASPVLGDALRGKVKDGEVPAWDQWFPPGALAATLPEGSARETFVSELTTTPLAYLEEAAPELDLPGDIGWAYLRLSKAYEDEAKVARGQGVPTLRLARHHLAMMTQCAVPAHGVPPASSGAT